MAKFNLSEMTIAELLIHNSATIDELLKRKVIRTRNKPTGDYAEWLVANKLGYKLENNSKQGYDAVDENNIRYQIKARQICNTNKSRQLSVIRNLEDEHFDYLIAVIFNKNYTLNYAAKIPHRIISKYARFNSHQNGHILILKGAVLEDKAISDITVKLQ